MKVAAERAKNGKCERKGVERGMFVMRSDTNSLCRSALRLEFGLTRAVVMVPKCVGAIEAFRRDIRIGVSK